jgi:hypothetical protein
VAPALLTTAMIREFSAARSISASLKSTRYQSSVNPTHSAFSRESLKENSTTTASGR